MTRLERMKKKLYGHFNPVHLELTDVSAKHAGHAGAQPGGETHYTLVIEAEIFSGMSRVKRHQVVYALLAEEFASGLHALAIEARAPGEGK